MIYGSKIRERTFTSTIQRLARAAPTMPLSEANKLADELAIAEADLFRMKSALAILSEALGFSGDGSPPESLDGPDLAIRWALDKVTECQGWVICGLDPDAMENLKAQVAEG